MDWINVKDSIKNNQMPHKDQPLLLCDISSNCIIAEILYLNKNYRDDTYYFTTDGYEEERIVAIDEDLFWIYLDSMSLPKLTIKKD